MSLHPEYQEAINDMELMSRMHHDHMRSMAKSAGAIGIIGTVSSQVGYQLQSMDSAILAFEIGGWTLFWGGAISIVAATVLSIEAIKSMQSYKHTRQIVDSYNDQRLN